jgi:hypothetical protein
MRKLACAIIIFLFSLSTFLVENADASTGVSGVLTSDTTWTAAQSPIQLTGPVCVNVGVTLTIEAGVTIDFDQYYLQVNGTIIARGTADNKIVLTTNKPPQPILQQVQLMPSSTSWNDQTGSGCIIENAALNQVSVVARGCSPKISNNVFTKPFWIAVQSTEGSILLSDNVFQNVDTEGISVGKLAVVTNNVFSVTTGDATAIVAHDNAYVANNKIMSFYNGITVDSHVTIKGNTVVNCSNAGIWCASDTITVESNYIANNHIGILSGGITQYNTIINNEIGIQTQSPLVQATIKNNNIVGSTKNSMVLTSPVNVDATNNWWGTTDNHAINQSIRDYKNDFNLGTVTFVPFLTEPNPQAPSSSDISNILTPADQPTSEPQNPDATPNQPNAPTDIPAQGGPQQAGVDPSLYNNSLLITIAVVLVILVVFFGVLIVIVARKHH